MACKMTPVVAHAARLGGLLQHAVSMSWPEQGLQQSLWGPGVVQHHLAGKEMAHAHHERRPCMREATLSSRLCQKWCMSRPMSRPRSRVPRCAAQTADSLSLHTRQKMMNRITGMPAAKAVRQTPSSLHAPDLAWAASWSACMPRRLLQAMHLEVTA